LHDCGSSAYGKDPVSGAEEYLFQVLDDNIQWFARFDFILAALWGKVTGNKVIDFSGLRGIENDWPENPDISDWVVQDGWYVPQCWGRKEDWSPDAKFNDGRHKRRISSVETCGDTRIAFGKEEEFRRTVDSLYDYRITWPNLGALEPSQTHNIQTAPSYKKVVIDGKK
jgi:hypothetical protein